MGIPAKITSKGQVTIPKKIRTILKTNVIEFLIDENGISIKPVRDVGGTLHKYSRKYEDIRQVKEKVWKAVAHEKGKGNHS